MEIYYLISTAGQETHTKITDATRDALIAQNAVSPAKADESCSTLLCTHFIRLISRNAVVVFHDYDGV